MSHEGISSGEDALAAERRRGTVDSKRLQLYLDGSEEVGTFRELVALRIESDAELLDEQPRVDMSRAEEREVVMRKVRSVVQLWREQRRGEAGGGQRVSNAGTGVGKPTISEAFYDLFALYDPAWSIKLGVHFGLFQSSVVGQATDEQREHWEPRIANMAIFGCFAMTELGHGSNVKGLETTAHYDAGREEFVIHSPTLTSTKWWIGGAGQTATHSAVYARLILGDTDHGVHTFVVPIRSLADGAPCPGVEVGDCGHKFGRNGLDNGWIRFSHVRIPRMNMLMRYAQVSREGVYSPPPKKELAYGALMLGRVGLVRDCTRVLKKATTISLRYACVRRQGYADESSRAELAVLDYPVHQHRLFQVLAAAYCFHFAAERLRAKYALLVDALAHEDLTELASMHAASAGMKAFVTWYTVEALEVCRQVLGGHGYSAYCGLTSLIGDHAVQVSWEGDNNVLSLQLARHLVTHCAPAVARGERLDGFEAYLGAPAAAPPSASGGAHGPGHALRDPDWQLAALRHCAHGLVMDTYGQLSVLEERMSHAEAWRECQVDLVECARAHTHYYMQHFFAEAVRCAPPELRESLGQLRDLHVLSLLQRYWVPRLVATDFLDAHHAGLLPRTAQAVAAELRPNAVALTDAFALPDLVLGPFGRHDGRVYEHYFDLVRRAPGCQERPPWYEDVLHPFLRDGEQLVDKRRAKL